jgi:hypothetical protein
MNSCLVKEQIAFGIAFLPNDMLIRYFNMTARRDCHCDQGHRGADARGGTGSSALPVSQLRSAVTDDAKEPRRLKPSERWECPLKSAKGQTEKSGRTTRKSASPPTPDIVNAGWHVSKVPRPDFEDMTPRPGLWRCRGGSHQFSFCGLARGLTTR